MSHAGTEDKYLKTLFPQNMEGLKVLDVGHGIGLTGLYIRGELIDRGWCQLYGVDIYKPYHLLQQRLGIYDAVFLRDARNGLPFPNKSINIAIMQQFIEHVYKPDGILILEEAERVTTDKIIVCTPNGFHDSGPGTHGNQHSAHLSGWTVEDFHKHGYHTQIVTKNVNSRALQLFAKFWFMLQRRRHWENEMIVAWKIV
jgi:SAM-dependent methyltransferase